MVIIQFSNSFPLFRLPLVALKEIFKLMDSRDLFFISFLSSNARKAIKPAIPSKNPYHVQFDVSSDLKVTIRNSEPILFCEELSREMADAFSCRMGNELIIYSKEHGYCYWTPPEGALSDSRLIYFQCIFQYFTEVFNNPAMALFLPAETSEVVASGLLKGINGLQLKINKLHTAMNLSADGCTALLNECSNVETLCINSEIPMDFEYNPPATGFQVDTLEISPSYEWVKLEHFMQCKRIILRAESYIFTPEYLNFFFKKIIATDCNLEYLEIALVLPATFSCIVQGLPGKRIQTNPHRPSFEIKKTDGKVYIITMEFSSLVMRKSE